MERPKFTSRPECSLPLILAGCLLLLVSCAGPLRNLAPARLSADEDQQVAENWAIAERIARYDAASWIATDSLLKYLTQEELKAVKGYVVQYDDHATKVVFGHLGVEGLLKVFESIVVENGMECKEYSPPVLADDAQTRMFRCMNSAREINQARLDSAKVQYNSYVLALGDSFVVYFVPGSTEQYLVLCGGIRTLFGKDLGIRKNEYLHASPVVFPMKKPREAIFRTSSQGDLLNEVDIAQFLIYRRSVPKQYVVTRKYIFALQFDRSAQKVSMITTSKE